MNYEQALDYMFSQLPMFHRIGAPAYKANLDNTMALRKLTGNPDEAFRSIHVAGTNGKGSVSNMLASIFMESGFKTGLFTSPHLIDFRERIRVNGEMVSKTYVAGFINKYMNDFNTIKPSFFEMTFAMAMSYFKEMKVDIAIVEAGLGGRLDSTNIITPELSVITNIGYDHMQFLGNSLEAIAGEKAGIIKPGIPVVIGESNDETNQVFINKALESGSRLLFADKAIETTEKGFTSDGGIILDVKSSINKYEIISPLIGNYQIKNIATVVAAIEILNETSNIVKKNPGGSDSELHIGDSLTSGIKNTLANTGFQGRWQILGRNPLRICDIGHNTHGLNYVVKQINLQTFKSLHFVLGVVNDKDVSGILSLLPIDATYYFCKANIPRGLDSSELKRMANASGLKGHDCETVEKAYNAALKNAEINDLIFIGGSAFVVAEVLPLALNYSNS